MRTLMCSVDFKPLFCCFFVPSPICLCLHFWSLLCRVTSGKTCFIDTQTIRCHSKQFKQIQQICDVNKMYDWTSWYTTIALALQFSQWNRTYFHCCCEPLDPTNFFFAVSLNLFWSPIRHNPPSSPPPQVQTINSPVNSNQYQMLCARTTRWFSAWYIACDSNVWIDAITSKILHSYNASSSSSFIHTHK